MKAMVISIIVFLSLLNAKRYTTILKREEKKEVNPALAMWFLFALAVSLSTVSLLFESSWNWEAAAFGIADMAMCISVSVGIIRRDGNKIVLDSFEKYYIGVILGAVSFWVLTKNSVGMNVVAQSLLIAAYVPTVRRMAREKKNTEPLSIWYCSLANSILSLYLSIGSGEVLAVIYSVRSLLSTSFLLTLMHKYERRNRKQNA